MSGRGRGSERTSAASVVVHHRYPAFLSKDPSDNRIDVNGNGTIFSSPVTASTTMAASADSTALRAGYMYPLAAYLNFFPGGIQYPCCHLDGTAEDVTGEEAAAALDSSDPENNFRSHS